MRAGLIGFLNLNEEDYCKKVTLMIKQIENKSNVKETVGMEKRLVRNVQDKKLQVFVQVLPTILILTLLWFVLFGFFSLC